MWYSCPMQVQKLLRWGVLAGIFLIPLVPFIVASPFFFPFITGKNFAFRIIVEVVVALWVLLALRDPSVRPRKSALLYVIVAFVAALALSDAVGENPAKSFWSNFERMEGWISLIHFAAYFVVMSSMLNAERLWRAFWNTSIGVSALLSVYGLFQLGGALTINQGGVRVDATFGNATYLAVYMLFHFFITILAAGTWTKNALVRVAYAGALVLQAVMIFYTATRGTILGLVGGLFLAGLLFVIFGRGHATLRKAGAALALIIVLVVGGFVGIKDAPWVQHNEVLSRLAQISLEAGQTRFAIWQMALKGAVESPKTIVLGWGQENFNYLFNKYYTGSLYAQEPWFDRAHNEFIDWLVAGGVIALGLYVSFFAIVLWYLWRPRSAFSMPERALLTGLLGGYAFHNLFVFDNLVSYILFFSTLAYIVMRHNEEGQLPAVTGSTPMQAKSAVTLSNPVVNGVSAATVLIMLGALYYLNVPGMVRAAALIDAVQPHCVDGTGKSISCNTVSAAPGARVDYQHNYDSFKKAVMGGGIGRQEAHEQLAQFALQLGNQNISALTTADFKSEVLTFTKEKFSAEVAREPNDARMRIFYGSFLRQIGDTVNAKLELEKALALSPHKQSIMFELGILATQTGDAQAAVKWFKQAYDEAPQFDEARSFYVATLIRVGDRSTADQLLIERYGTRTPDNDYVLQAYLDVKDFESVIAIAKARVEAAPTDAQKVVQLAAAYYQAGMKADAIAGLRKAAEINTDPAFKAQVDSYIQGIESGTLQ